MMERSADSIEITRVVRDVRRRWRLGRAIRGATIALGGSVLALVIAAMIMSAFDYSDAAVGAARIAIGIVIIVLIGRFVVVPLLPRPRDEQVALYLEEREPAFEGSFVTAVEAGGSGASVMTSPALLARLMHAARTRARAVGDGRNADAPVLRSAWMMFAAVALVSLFATLVASDSLRQGIGLLLRPSYWPGFPWAQLAASLDAFVPMTYSSYRTLGVDGVFGYTVANVALLRALVGDPAIPVHVVGGVASSLRVADVDGFVRAAQQQQVAGASLYDAATTRAALWPRLAPLVRQPAGADRRPPP